MSIQTPFVIFIIIISISSIIGQSDDGIIKVSSSDIPTSSQSSLANSDNNSKNNSSVATTTTNSSVLVNVITEIYNFALKPIGKLIVFIVKTMANIILYPVGKILNGALHLIGIHDIGGKISSLITNITRIYTNYITNIGAIAAAIFDIMSESHDEETHRIAKRSIMDMVASVEHAGTIPPFLVEEIGSIPSRIISEIIDVLLYPFRAMYRMITWPYRVVFGSDDDTTNRIKNGANRDNRSTKINNQINNMMNKILNNMSDTTQVAMAKALSQMWKITKSSILPQLDHFLERISKLQMLPTSLKTFAERTHKFYQFAHLFSFL